MARVNLSLPDELRARVRAELPGLNLSGVLAEALTARLGCSHGRLVCVACRATLTRAELVEAALTALYVEDLAELEAVVDACGSAEGACRVLRRVAGEHGVRVAVARPLPRATRASRQAAAEQRACRASVPGSGRSAWRA